MNCPNCGAPLLPVTGKSYLACEYCASFYFPEKSQDGVRILGEAAELDCPVCRQPLLTAVIEAFPLEHAHTPDDRYAVLACGGCRGLLLRQADLPPILRELRARVDGPAVPARPYAPQELGRRLACPRCGKRMDTHPYGGPGNVVIDNCMDCGLVWLDSEELGKIAHAPGRDRTTQE
jgi:DNA-directed RNA polymerase subunit RPC12/RpoP